MCTVVCRCCLLLSRQVLLASKRVPLNDGMRTDVISGSSQPAVSPDCASVAPDARVASSLLSIWTAERSAKQEAWRARTACVGRWWRHRGSWHAEVRRQQGCASAGVGPLCPQSLQRSVEGSSGGNRYRESGPVGQEVAVLLGQW